MYHALVRAGSKTRASVGRKTFERPRVKMHQTETPVSEAPRSTHLAIVKIVKEDRGTVPIQNRTFARSPLKLAPVHLVASHDMRMQLRKGSAKELCWMGLYHSFFTWS